MKKGVLLGLAALLMVMTAPTTVLARPGQEEPQPQPAAAMTAFETPRNETVIVQRFDNRSSAPDLFNPYLDYNRWGAIRMLGFMYLWETDTGTGETVSELAAGPPEPLNDSYTRFRVRLRSGIYWSDGVEFTAEDVIYTIETAIENAAKLPRDAGEMKFHHKSHKLIDRYTLEIETNEPAYYFAQDWGVWTWGATFLYILPKHVYEAQPDISQFKDSDPVVLGAYTVENYDPNGFWEVWKLRDDWERSGWQVYTDERPGPTYVVYQGLGPEDKQVAAFIQNDLDAATFMSWDAIKAVQRRNPEVRTFSDKFPLFWNDDACAFGIEFNAQKVPYNNKDVRWALALATDLKNVTLSALGGAFRVSAIPMVAQPWMKETYFDPLLPWLENFELDDGYKPFNRNYAEEMKDILRQRGVEDLPARGEETDTLMGLGWWKYDLEEAEKLMLKAGMQRGADGKWRLPNGERWQPILQFPADWHTILQRMGFAIADSWEKFGIDVVAKQMDQGEYNTVRYRNDLHDALIRWPNCSYVSPIQIMRELRQEYLKPADSSERIIGNYLRWDNAEADRLIEQMLNMPSDDPRVVDMNREALKMMIEDMALINLSDIPTTIPENWYYWEGWPTADNYYSTPLTWWSNFKHVVMNLKPTGR